MTDNDDFNENTVIPQVKSAWKPFISYCNDCAKGFVNWMPKFVRRMFWVLVSGTAAALVAMVVMQRKLIYVPYMPPDSRKRVATPTEYGIKQDDWREVWLTAKDDSSIHLHAYWINVLKTESNAPPMDCP